MNTEQPNQSSSSNLITLAGDKEDFELLDKTWQAIRKHEDDITSDFCYCLIDQLFCYPNKAL